MIQFSCPCGKALHAKDEYAGQTTRCPGCGRELVIPGEQGVTAEAPTPRERPEGGVRPDWSRLDERESYRRSRPPAFSGMAVASLILGVLSLLCSVFSALPAVVLGAFGLRAIARSEGRLRGKGLAIAGLVLGGLALLAAPALFFLGYQRVEEANHRMASSNNLKIMALAMHDYNDATGSLPPAAICDPQGKPLLSWRVAILPYVESGSLYQQFKLDEPWDGPHNIQLLSQMPKYYALPGDSSAPPGYTYYRVFVPAGPNPSTTLPAFDAPQPGKPFGVTPGVSLAAGFTDGTANTILIAEAATAVPWTKPDELVYDPSGPLPALGGHFRSGFMVAFADGSVRMIPANVSEATLRAAITRDGGEVLDVDW